MTRYWLAVAAKKQFAIDQSSIVPDHLHLIVRIVPKSNIEEVALLLLNNGQYFMGSTCDEMTTALIMKWCLMNSMDLNDLPTAVGRIS